MKDFFKKNVRYLLAGGVILAAFLIGNDFFAVDRKTSSDCRDGKCLPALSEPDLSDQKPVHYFNDLIETGEGNFYRLVFRARADRDTRIKIYLSTVFDEKQFLGEITVSKNEKVLFQERNFSASKKYTDVIFEKSEPGDGAGVFLEDARLTRLNVSSEKELSRLRPTIFGEVDLEVINQSQTKENSQEFPQLIEKKGILGQIFRSELDYMSGVTFDIDVIREGSGGNRKYRLELREAIINEDGSGIKIKSPMERFSFTPAEIENYRREDGLFRFPLFSNLEKGKTYFIGINSDKVETNKFNTLVFRGSADKNSYSEGTALFKLSGTEYPLDGNLYFSVHGASFKEFGGEKVLLGSIIEDTGSGAGLFTYRSQGTVSDLIDLWEHSDDAEFDSLKEAVCGEAKGNSFYTYKFSSFYPMTKIALRAKEISSGWTPSRLFYSFDNQNWEEIFPGKKGARFELETETPFLPKEFYLKTTYDSRKTKSGSESGEDEDPESFASRYGIRNLEVKADLKME